MDAKGNLLQTTEVLSLARETSSPMTWNHLIYHWLGRPSSRRQRSHRRSSLRDAGEDHNDSTTSSSNAHRSSYSFTASSTTSSTVRFRRPSSLRRLLATNHHLIEHHVVDNHHHISPSSSSSSGTTANHHNRDNIGGSDNNHHTHPLLYTLTKRWVFPAVLIRIQTHPQEVHAMLGDEEGNNFLHWACFGRAPLEIIQAFLSECPELARVQNVAKGLLPLHVACTYRASSDVIRALLIAYPDGAGIKTTRGGSTPLHLLCDSGCSVDAIRAILETRAGRKSVLQEDDRFHRTPLQLLHTRRNRALFSRSIEELRMKLGRQQQRQQNDLQPSHDDSNDDSIRNYTVETSDSLQWPDGLLPFLHEYWEKATLLVLEEYNMRLSTSCDHNNNVLLSGRFGPSHVVHACVAIPNCPPSVLELALLLYPDQLLVPDDHGRLPLHIAASKLAQEKDAASKTILLDVLTACPQAAQHRDEQLRLPLQLCGASAWNESVAYLISAYPLGLTAIDFHDALYPYIWARIALRRQDATQVLFELIREKPNLFGPCGNAT